MDLKNDNLMGEGGDFYRGYIDPNKGAWPNINLMLEHKGKGYQNRFYSSRYDLRKAFNICFNSTLTE